MCGWWKKTREQTAGDVRLAAVAAAEGAKDVERKGKVGVNWVLDAGRCEGGAHPRCQSGAFSVAHARGSVISETNVGQRSHLTGPRTLAQASTNVRASTAQLLSSWSSMNRGQAQ